MRRLILVFLLATNFVSFCLAQNFTLKSKTLHGQATLKEIFNGFDCNGENKSPQLEWYGSPIGTKSYAITIYDVDATTGSGWWHWLVFDIPHNLSNLEEGVNLSSTQKSSLNIIQSINDFGIKGYCGPCPPKGDKPHQYIVTIYALKVEKLGLDSNANPALVGYYINANTIAKSSLIFYSSRTE